MNYEQFCKVYNLDPLPETSKDSFDWFERGIAFAGEARPQRPAPVAIPKSTEVHHEKVIEKEPFVRPQQGREKK